MLPKKFRLRRKEDVEAVFKGGESIIAPELILRFRPNTLETSRVAILVGKKLAKKAVQRNRLKRRIGELARIHFAQIPTGFDLLIVVREIKLLETEFAEIEKIFLALLQKWTNRNS